MSLHLYYNVSFKTVVMGKYLWLSVKAAGHFP